MAQNDDKDAETKKLEELAKELDRRRGQEWFAKLVAAKPELERLGADMADDAAAAITANVLADQDPNFEGAAQDENARFREKHADRHLRLLDKLNSSAPATQEFLFSRGLTSIRQLDEQGRKDLIKFLQGKLDELLNKNK